MTTSAAASAASTSPRDRSKCANTTSDSSGSNTGASGSVRSRTRSRASRRVSRSGAASRATGSAWCRISPPTGTRIGWSVRMLAMTFWPGMSSAVTTATRAQSKPGSRSMPARRARASVERIVAPYHAPGTPGRRRRWRARSAWPDPPAGVGEPRPPGRAARPGSTAGAGSWAGSLGPRGRRAGVSIVNVGTPSMVPKRGAPRRAVSSVLDRSTVAGPVSPVCRRARIRSARIRLVRRPVPASAPGPGWRRCARRRPRRGPR